MKYPYDNDVSYYIIVLNVYIQSWKFAALQIKLTIIIIIITITSKHCILLVVSTLTSG